MKFSRSCFCRKISSQAEVAGSMMVACYCIHCQIFCDALQRAAAIARADTVIIDGDVNQFVKKAESGNHRIHAFDGTCGSQLFATDLDRSMFNILIGCLDQRAQIKPKRDIFESSALSFAKDLKKDKWPEKGLLSDLINPLQ